MLRRRYSIPQREEAQNTFGLDGGTKVALLAKSSVASFGVEEESCSLPLLHPPPGTLDFRYRRTDGSPAHRGPMRTAQGEQRSPLTSCLSQAKGLAPPPTEHTEAGTCRVETRQDAGNREECAGSLPWKPERALNFKVVPSVAFRGV